MALIRRQHALRNINQSGIECYKHIGATHKFTTKCTPKIHFDETRTLPRALMSLLYTFSRWLFTNQAAARMKYMNFNLHHKCHCCHQRTAACLCYQHCACEKKPLTSPYFIT